MRRFRASKRVEEASVGVEQEPPVDDFTDSLPSVPEENPIPPADADSEAVDVGAVSFVDSELSIDLRDYDIDPYVAHILPEQAVRRLNMLPIRIEEDVLHVAVTEPVDLPGIDEIKLMTGLKVEPVIVSEKGLSRAISEQFSAKQTSKQAIIDMTFQDMEVMSRQAVQVSLPELQEAPVVNLVNSVIHKGVTDKVSDIHLEPQYPEMRVRYRVNGLLHDVTTVPGSIEPAVIARIKLMADMDITERRRPQDGHIGIHVDGRQIDLRISTVLTVDGEKMVIRILDKETMLIRKDNLGMTPEQLELFKSIISHPYGMILVTGPTGSGKSTTLYAVLSELDSYTNNIVTVENPVEYQMPGINQISVNPLINMTFATALRTIVRQDPDIIMVGEIRDFETADIAINAALTGHLVFSTLHTNDAPGALVRLLDMGMQPFLTSSAVIGVVAQRLVRVICPECKELYTPSDEERRFLKLPDDVTELARGKGCDYCLNTGYYGRTGIFEIFEMDEDVRKLVLAQAPSSDIKNLTLSKGMKSLSESGREKVVQKVSTVADLRRVIYTGKD